jgi:hypothetical protein
VIIQCDPFADLTGGSPDYGVGVGVVVGAPAENLHPQGPFFQVAAAPLQRLRHHITQESGIVLAVKK